MLERVSEHVYANTQGISGGNVGIITLNEQVIAVDSQYMLPGFDFRQSIGTISDNPVTMLLLTHYHRDHVFGNQAFMDCEIVAHRLTKQQMMMSLNSEWAPDALQTMMAKLQLDRPLRQHLYESDGLKIVLPTKTFNKQYLLDADSSAIMIHTGGHTAGSSIVVIPEDKILFAGDIVFVGRFPWAGDPTADPDAWIRAFETILELKVDLIIPGHGPLCDNSEITKHLLFFQTVKSIMLQLIAEGQSMEDIIHDANYPDFYEPTSDYHLQRRETSLKHWYTTWKNRMLAS
jgi:glyoxylase-like metal-dependent hydrolase (beta-lactamase superfamily II)